METCRERSGFFSHFPIQVRLNHLATLPLLFPLTPGRGSSTVQPMARKPQNIQFISYFIPRPRPKKSCTDTMMKLLQYLQALPEFKGWKVI